MTIPFSPPILRGLTIHPENPLRFDFIVDRGETQLKGDELKTEYEKLIKYFLAALTIPEDDLWVNLSPYEKERIIPNEFGQTEMGRDLLAQDYILKQLMASLTYPESGLGKKFWDEVYKKAYEQYGTTNIPLNTFNKVWIVPEKAVVYENKDKAFVVQSYLKVMLEEDYLALNENLKNEKLGTNKQKEKDVKQISNVSSLIAKEILIPAIEKEVNENKNFAQLRQIYNSMILAVWYKKALKDKLLNKVYSNQKKIKGVDADDPKIKEKIYQQYIDAFKTGVYSMIKEDNDPYMQKVIPRKYFSGGFNGPAVKRVQQTEYEISNSDMASLAEEQREHGWDQVEANVLPPAVAADVVNTIKETQRKSKALGNAGEVLKRVLRKTASLRGGLIPSLVLLGESSSLAWSRRKNVLSESAIIPAEVDFAIASDNSGGLTRRQHEAYHEAGQFAQVIQEIAIELGAELRADGKYDLRQSVVKAGGFKKTSHGELRIEKDGTLVIIDSRFQKDHAGRGERAVYARTEAKAKHELSELRDWINFALEKGIVTQQDVIDGKLGIKLQAWANENSENRQLAEKLRDEFHNKALHVEFSHKLNEWVSAGILTQAVSEKLQSKFTTAVIEYILSHGMNIEIKNLENDGVHFSLALSPDGKTLITSEAFLNEHTPELIEHGILYHERLHPIAGENTLAAEFAIELYGIARLTNRLRRGQLNLEELPSDLKEHLQLFGILGSNGNLIMDLESEDFPRQVANNIFWRLQEQWPSMGGFWPLMEASMVKEDVDYRNSIINRGYDLFTKIRETLSAQQQGIEEQIDDDTPFDFVIASDGSRSPRQLAIYGSSSSEDWNQAIVQEHRWHEGVNFAHFFEGKRLLVIGDTNHDLLGIQKGLVEHLKELKDAGVSHLALEIESDLNINDIDHISQRVWIPHRFRQLATVAQNFGIEIIFMDMPKHLKNPIWTSNEWAFQRGVYMGNYLKNFLLSHPTAKVAAVTGYAHITDFEEIPAQLEAGIPYTMVALVSEGQPDMNPIAGTMSPFLLPVVGAIAGISRPGQSYGYVDLLGLSFEARNVTAIIHFSRPMPEAPTALALPAPESSTALIDVHSTILLQTIDENQITTPMHLNFKDRVMPHSLGWQITNEKKIIEFVSRLNLNSGQKMYLTALLFSYAQNTGRHSLGGSILNIGFVPEGQFFEIVTVDTAHYEYDSTKNYGAMQRHLEISLRTLQQRFGFSDMFVEDLSELPEVIITNNPDRPLSIPKIVPLILAALKHPNRVYAEWKKLKVFYHDVPQTESYPKGRILTELEVEDFALNNVEYAFYQAERTIVRLWSSLTSLGYSEFGFYLFNTKQIHRLQSVVGRGGEGSTPYSFHQRSWWLQERSFSWDNRFVQKDAITGSSESQRNLIKRSATSRNQPRSHRRSRWSFTDRNQSKISSMIANLSNRNRMGKSVMLTLEKATSQIFSANLDSFWANIDWSILKARKELRYLRQDEIKTLLDKLDGTINLVQGALNEVDNFLSNYAEWGNQRDEREKTLQDYRDETRAILDELIRMRRSILTNQIGSTKLNALPETMDQEQFQAQEDIDLNLEEPGQGPGGGPIIEGPNNKVREAENLIAQGRFEEAKELLQEAIDGFQMIIDGNQDTDPNNLGYQMARAARRNKEIAERLLQVIQQKQNNLSDKAVGDKTIRLYRVGNPHASGNVSEYEPYRGKWFSSNLDYVLSYVEGNFVKNRTNDKVSFDYSGAKIQYIDLPVSQAYNYLLTAERLKEEKLDAEPDNFIIDPSLPGVLEIDLGTVIGQREKIFRTKFGNPTEARENKVSVRKHLEMLDVIKSEATFNDILEFANAKTKNGGAVVENNAQLGGIDLTRKRLPLETQGEGVDFNLPFDPNHLDQIPVNGLTPVIFKIESVPIENFPLILGLVEEPSKELSAVH